MFEGAGAAVDIVVPFGVDGDPFRYLALAPGTILGVDVPELSGRSFRLDATGPGENDTLVLGLSEILPQRYTAAGGVTLPPPIDPDDQLPDPPDTEESLMAPTGLAIAFHSIVTQGDVVTQVMFRPGDGMTPPSGDVTITGLAVESNRELVVTWDALADADPDTDPPTAADPAIGFHLLVIETLSPDEPGQSARTLVDQPLERDVLEYRRPYRTPPPDVRYNVTLWRRLTNDRRSESATAMAMSPADRTSLPGGA